MTATLISRHPQDVVTAGDGGFASTRRHLLLRGVASGAVMAPVPRQRRDDGGLCRRVDGGCEASPPARKGAELLE